MIIINEAKLELKLELPSYLSNHEPHLFADYEIQSIFTTNLIQIEYKIPNLYANFYNFRKIQTNLKERVALFKSYGTPKSVY